MKVAVPEKSMPKLQEEEEEIETEIKPTNVIKPAETIEMEIEKPKIIETPKVQEEKSSVGFGNLSHNFVIYSRAELEEQASTQMLDEDDDSFYDITVQDLQKMQSSLQKSSS